MKYLERICSNVATSDVKKVNSLNVMYIHFHNFTGHYILHQSPILQFKEITLLMTLNEKTKTVSSFHVSHEEMLTGKNLSLILRADP